MTDLYRVNLSTLTEKNRNAAIAVDNARDSVELAKSKSGVATGSIRGVLLHSRYDPVKEAVTQVRLSGARPGSQVVVYGFGLGHHVAEFLNIVGPSGRVVTAEAETSILKAALTVIDPGLLSDPRLTIVSGPDENSILSELSKVFTSLDPDRTVVAIHDPSFRVMPDVYKNLRNAIELIRMERRFPAVMGDDEKKNLSDNMPIVLQGGAVSQLHDIYPGGTVIVVGAGPTLERDVIYLASDRNRFAILASDTSLPVLLANGVTPDLLFTADPQPASRLHFLLADRYDLPLVALPTANSDILKRWEGDIYVGFINPEKYPAPADSWAASRGVFRSGGSVSCLALETALMMGAGRVVLVGQDFSYPFGKIYADGTAPAELDMSVDMSGKDIVECKNHFGSDVKTSINLHSYRRAFEDMARDNSQVEIITLSPDGAVLEGIAAVSFASLTGGKESAVQLPALTPGKVGEDVVAAFMSYCGIS